MSATLTYRHVVSQDDVEAIHVMVAASGVFSEEEVEVAVELADDAHAAQEHSHYRFAIAECNGKIVGYTCFGRVPLTDNRYDLYWIVVDGNAQQQGVATGLMAQTEEKAKALGCKILYAETSSRTVYAPAQAFYRKHGFELEARLKDFYADGDDKMIFAKRV